MSGNMRKNKINSLGIFFLLPNRGPSAPHFGASALTPFLPEEAGAVCLALSHCTEGRECAGRGGVAKGGHSKAEHKGALTVGHPEPQAVLMAEWHVCVGIT